MRAADAAHRVGAAVLLVIGVEDEQHVERALEHRADLVLELRHPEQHVQEVAGEAEVVVGIVVGAADAVAIGVGGNRRNLRDEAMNLLLAGLLVEDLPRVHVEGGERAHSAEEHAHRMGVVLEPFHELLDVLVQHRVQRDLLGPLLELRVGRQLSEDDEIRRLEIRRLFGELLDRIAAIFQDALVAVDVGDAAPARRGVHERRVVGAEPLIVLVDFDLAKIGGADGAVGDGNLVQLARAIVSNSERVGHMRAVSVGVGVSLGVG